MSLLLSGECVEAPLLNCYLDTFYWTQLTANTSNIDSQLKKKDLLTAH